MIDPQVKKGVALNPNNHLALYDHLIPLTSVLDIPLLITDEHQKDLLSALYPSHVRFDLMDWEQVSPQYLFNEYDYFLQSEMWSRDRFYQSYQLLEDKYGKIVRNIHVPHGFSDKVFWLREAAFEDITLYYGQNMLDLFEHEGLSQYLNCIVRTGNYRYNFYLNHQQFFDQMIEYKILNRFAKKQPIILYAPTHNDKERNSSFFESDPIFKNLPDHYNLLVKMHPLFEELDAAELYQMMGKYEKKGNIVFVLEMPLVFPLLAQSAVYVGDMSSIGYDFLSFNRPLFFLNARYLHPDETRESFLFKCGTVIYPPDYHRLYEFIENALATQKDPFKKTRKEMNRYTFGEIIPFEDLKQAILQSLGSKRLPLNI